MATITATSVNVFPKYIQTNKSTVSGDVLFFNLPPELRSQIYSILSSHDSYYPEVFDFRSPSISCLKYSQVSSLFRHEFLTEYHARRWFTIWNIERPMEKLLENNWLDAFVGTRMRFVRKLRFWTKRGIPLEVILGKMHGETMAGGMKVRAPYEPIDGVILRKVGKTVEGFVKEVEDGSGEVRLDEVGFVKLVDLLREKDLLHGER